VIVGFGTPLSGTVHEGKTLLYRASKFCDVCPLKRPVLPKEPSRKIPRDIHEHARDVARSFTGTRAFWQSRLERKKIEMRFGHLKRILRLGPGGDASKSQNLRSTSSQSKKTHPEGGAKSRAIRNTRS
jgi:hypothetical protein